MRDRCGSANATAFRGEGSSPADRKSPIESVGPRLAADQHRRLAIAACGTCASEVPRSEKIGSYTEDSAVRLYVGVEVLDQRLTASLIVKTIKKILATVAASPFGVLRSRLLSNQGTANWPKMEGLNP